MRDIISRRMNELGINNIRELERAAGVKKDVIGNMLRGRSKSVRSESIVGIAQALRISLSELLTGTEELTNSGKWQTLDVCKSSDNLDFPDGAEQIGFAAPIDRFHPDDGTDFVFKIEDNTMAPTLQKGDLALIRRLQGTCHSLIDGAPQDGHSPDADEPNHLSPSNVYLLKTKHAGFNVRRLATRISDGKVDIHTDNSDFPNELGIAADKISIYGTVEVVIKRL